MDDGPWTMDDGRWMVEGELIAAGLRPAGLRLAHQAEPGSREPVNEFVQQMNECAPSPIRLFVPHSLTAPHP